MISVFSVEPKTYVSLCYKKLSKNRKDLEIRVQDSEIFCRERADYFQCDGIEANVAYNVILGIVEKSLEEIKLAEEDNTEINVKETLAQKISKKEISIKTYSNNRGGKILVRDPVKSKINVTDLILELAEYQDKANAKANA